MLYTEEAIKNRQNKVRKIKNIFSIFFYILLIPILLYNVSLVIQAVSEPNKTPSFLGYKTYVIVSGSMEPEINIGDIVIAKECKKDDLKNGDIISYRKGQSVVTHRIIEIKIEEENIKYITKGDNNNIEDSETIEYDQIEGLVINRIPKIGKFTLLLQGKILIIVIAIIIYLYVTKAFNIGRRKDIRNQKRIQYEESKKKEENNEKS